MKGYLNDKEVKTRVVTEIYEDGTSGTGVDGNSHDILIMLLDMVVTLAVSIKKQGTTNEDIARFVRDYILSSLNICEATGRTGVFNNDLC